MSTPRPSVTRFATRQNARLAYDPGSPSGDGDTRSSVVLLHDLLADRTAWNPVRDTLAGRYRVIIPDARGHGASATLTNRWYTVAELAADLLSVLDAEGIPVAHLVGDGLGGVTAFDVARRHPTRVRSLTLIAPPLYAILDGDPDPKVRAARFDRRTSDRAAADAAYKGLLDKAVDTFLVPRRGADWRQAMTRHQLGAISRHAAALAALLPALDSYTVDRTGSSRLDLPVLVVAASDHLIERRVAEHVSVMLPQARLEAMRFAGMGHAAPSRDDWSALITDWLAACDTS